MSGSRVQGGGWATLGGRVARPLGLGAATLVAALVLLAPAAAPFGAPPRLDPKTEAVWTALTAAMGGQEAWDSLPYLRFDFVVEREGKPLARFRHWWDRARGRCRVEGPDERGRVVTAIFTLADRKGISFTDGMSDTDSANIAGILENGYQRWVNDTYWLMMPFKLRDPGAHLKYAREERAAGATYDVLELSFDPGTGLTPGDRYWLFVNRGTGLPDRWEFLLQGRKPPPDSATWERWTRVGPVRLSLERRMTARSTVIRFENVAAPTAMDESIFKSARPAE